MSRVLAGRYVLGARIGRGGMGTVWRATDRMLDREVAVKELSVGDLAEEDLQIVHSRMKQEARAAARIKHPSVITIHDVLEQDGKPWIVMELIDGRSLAELVEQEGVLDPREAARIGARVLAPLERAHAVGVIHRDVKPANVLLERGTGRVVLTDFGIATFVGDSALTRTGDLVGSPDYLAPECVHGGRPGPESDLWALGATLYAAVEGHSPFRRGSPLTTLVAVVTDPLPEPRNAGALTPVLRALMAKDPQHRPRAGEVLRMLESVVAGRTTSISLGPNPLGTVPHEVVAPVGWHDRPEGCGAAGPVGGYPPAALGAVRSPTTAGQASEAGRGQRADGGTSGPTARIPSQTARVPASASSGPRMVTGPLFAEPRAGVRAGAGADATRVAAYAPPQSVPVGPGAGDTGAAAVARPTRRRRRAWAWLLAATLVAGGASAGATYWLHPRPTGPVPPANPATASPAGSGAASPSASAPAVPAGYAWTTDPDAGFSFGLPDTGEQPWARDASRGLGAIDYTPDGGTHLIRFGVTLSNTRTAMQQARYIRDMVQAHDSTFKQQEPLAANTYKGLPGTQLEFTYNDAKTGQARHELEQFWKAPNGNEYDFLVSYPATDWNNGYKRFEEVMQTFGAPSAR